MQNNASFLAMHEHPCIITRLIDQMREASREFREDPKAFVTSSFRAGSGGGRRKMLLQLGFAVAILFYALAFVSMLIFWSLTHQRARLDHSGNNPLAVIWVPGLLPNIDIPAGNDRPRGGGGGGRHTLTVPSGGKLPVSSVKELVVAPRPEPQLTPPVLPIIEKLMLDPRIQLKQDDLSLTGLPDASGLIPSAGSGSEGGLGTGSRGGIGPGSGPGFGPGSGGNVGDGSMELGVGRPSTAALHTAVDQRPTLLNQPRPLFTELARKNKVQGVVRIKILVDANGAVKEVVVLRGLPDGLNEQAIRAAYQMRFKPAMKNGQRVSYWLSNVEVEFNLR